MKDALSSLEEVCHTASRLRGMMVKVRSSSLEVAAEPWTQHEYSVSNAIEAMDNVVAEAQNLKVAFSSSLPVSYSGESSLNSPCIETSRVILDTSKTESKEANDIVTTFGMEIVLLILLAADIQIGRAHV